MCNLYLIQISLLENLALFLHLKRLYKWYLPHNLYTCACYHSLKVWSRFSYIWVIPKWCICRYRFRMPWRLYIICTFLGYHTWRCIFLHRFLILWRLYNLRPNMDFCILTFHLLHRPFMHWWLHNLYLNRLSYSEDAFGSEVLTNLCGLHITGQSYMIIIPRRYIFLSMMLDFHLMLWAPFMR